MNFSQILNDYKYTTELHCHTLPGSYCANFSPEEVVEIYKKAGASSIVLTNHTYPELAEGSLSENAKKYLEGYYRALDAAKDELNVILGMEIRFPENDNDYLIYGIDEDDVPEILSYIPYGIVNFYKHIKNEKNLIIQAHPMRKNMVFAPLGSIDGIESMNMHPGHNAQLSLAFRYAKENNLIVSGGTDFHHKGHQALCLMRTEKEMKNSFDVADALKAKSAVFDCSGHIIVPYVY